MAANPTADQLVGILRETVVSLVRRDGPDLSARQLGVFLTCYLLDGGHTVRGLAAELERFEAGDHPRARSAGRTRPRAAQGGPAGPPQHSRAAHTQGRGLPAGPALHHGRGGRHREARSCGSRVIAATRHDKRLIPTPRRTARCVRDCPSQKRQLSAIAASADGRAVSRPVLGPGPWDLVSSPTREFRPARTAHHEAEPAKLRQQRQQRNIRLGRRRRRQEDQCT